MEPDGYCVGGCRLLLQPTGTESVIISLFFNTDNEFSCKKE